MTTEVTESSNARLEQYQNNLTPPIGTNFWQHQTKKVFSRESLRWTQGHGTAWPAGEVTLVTDVYTYVTGADPRQPDYQDNNGMVYIVFVQSGKTEPNVELLSTDVWYRNTITSPDVALPILQLPESGSGEKLPDKTTTKYNINFDQMMPMFKNGGTDTTNFEAKYIKDFQRPISQQDGSLDVADSQVEFAVRFTDIPEDFQELPIVALSVFQCDDLSAFPMNFKFETQIGQYDIEGGWTTNDSSSKNVVVNIKTTV